MIQSQSSTQSSPMESSQLIQATAVLHRKGLNTSGGNGGEGGVPLKSVMLASRVITPDKAGPAPGADTP